MINQTNKFILSIFTLFCFSFNSQTTIDKIININGAVRNYRIYIPQMYTGNELVPLVFNFHGYGSTNLEQEFYGDFRPIADTANFILIHPQGLNGGSGSSWNNFATTASSNFDYMFISELIDSLIADYEIDTNRIYSTGMSNGGFMSYDLACFMSHRFAAIASVTGSMISTHLNVCNPVRKVPIMQIHGTNDLTVSYSGTAGILNSTPIESLVQFWVDHNQCESIPVVGDFQDINTTDNSTVTHLSYYNGSANAFVEFFKVQNGSHTWPGSVYDVPGLVTNHDFSASKEIWRFFNLHVLVEENPSTTSLNENDFTFAIYPNPTNSALKINLNNSIGNEINIFSSLGKLVKTVQIKNQKKIEISLEDLNFGIYFVEIGGKQEKIVVN